MKIRHSTLVFLTGFLALGVCADPLKPVDSLPKLAYGVLMKHGDKLVFSPCRDRSYAMMEDVSPERTVTRMLTSVGLETGKKLYVELFGTVEGGMFRVSGLNMARTEGRCQQPGGKDEAWRAAGNEPGWLLAAGGEQVIVKRLGKSDVVLPYAPFKSEGGVTQQELAGNGHKLALRFEKTACHDTMADSVFGWTVTVNLDGTELKGCAWQR